MRVHHDTKSAPRPGLLVLLVALSIVMITVWYREPADGPLHRLKGGVAVVTAPVSAGGEFVTRPLRGIFAWVSDLGVSRSQLERLRSQNASLRSRVAELEEAGLENARLRALLEIPQAREIESVGARVIGRPANAWEGVITIDKGADDGITEGMPVVGPLGLLGQTVQVSSATSRVRLITDHRSGVAALVQRSRAEGIVRGSVDGVLRLDFVSTDLTVTAGDVVITSGMGGVFPKGIVVGEVAQDGEIATGLTRSFRIVPAGDPAGLEEVLVLVGRPPAIETGAGE